MYTLTPEVVVRGLRRKLKDSKRRNTVRNYYKLSTNYQLETNNNEIPCKHTYRLVPYLNHGLYMGFQPKNMLSRIGSRIMDLTQGYHQAPFSNITKAYTAFITFSGVYKFTLLPFGPKRAPSNFQEIMATVVLVALIYMICEMYIDDCSVFGDTNIEFV